MKGLYVAKISTWPTRDEYDEALLDHRTHLADPELRRGHLYTKLGRPQRYGGAGLYVALYRIDDWMVRCFRSTGARSAFPLDNPLDNIVGRYQLLGRLTPQDYALMPALIPVEYQPRGVKVGDRWYPCVKMPYLTKAVPLGDYLKDHHTNSRAMAHLGHAWLQMIHEMEAVHMAHGDLDLTNVMVMQTDGSNIPNLKLIDYDNIWLPQLAGQRQTEYGHLAFQHPAFLSPYPRPYQEDMDRFSALVIYICIKALEVAPSLYEGSDSSERLLFTQDDYADPKAPAGRIMSVYATCQGSIRPYIEELCACLINRDMPCKLDDVPTRGRCVLTAVNSGRSTISMKMPVAIEGTFVAAASPSANRSNSTSVPSNPRHQILSHSQSHSKTAAPSTSNLQVAFGWVLFVIFVLLAVILVVWVTHR